MENRTIKIFIDDGSLEKTLASDQKLLEQLAQKQEKLRQGTKQWNELEEKRQATLKRIDTTQQQLNKTMGLTMEQLRRKSQELNKELNKMPIELRASSQAAANLKIIQAEMAKVKAETQATASVLSRIRAGTNSVVNGFNKYSGVALSFIAGITGALLSLRRSLELGREFEDAKANLSALTNLRGEQLEYLATQAKEMSKSEVEGNVRITQSASEILKAYTIVGSQRPELLKNKEALAEVTKQSMILSEASKMALEPSARAVTTAMNQFNLEAVDSSRIINSLAAGSQAGAADVTFLTTVMEKSGTTANMAGLSFETFVAAAETIAPKFKSAEEAGTQLRNAFIKLEMQESELRPSVVGLETALDNLAKRGMGVTDMQKMFGEGGFIAAAALIENRKQLVAYKDAVTDTNVAIEQAAINTDTATAKLAQQRNKMNEYAISLGTKLAPAAISASSAFNKFLGLIDEITNVPLSKKMEEDRIALKVLESQILNTNTRQEDRIKLIKQLQNQYPEYLGNLKAEEISNKQIADTVQQINKELVNKIILQKQDEKIADAAQNVATEKEKMLKAEMALMEEIVKIEDKYSNLIKVDKTLPLKEQAESILKVHQKLRSSFLGPTLKTYLDAYKAYNMTTSVREKELNEVMDERNKIMARLGIVTKEATTEGKQTVAEFLSYNTSVISELQQKRTNANNQEIGDIKQVLQQKLNELKAFRQARLKELSPDEVKKLADQEKLILNEMSKTKFKPTGGDDDKDDKVAKAKENYQKLIDANDKFIKDLHAKQLTGLQKELEQERLKFDEKIKELEDFKAKEGELLSKEQKKEIDDKVIELTKEQEAALQAIKVRYAKETNEKIEQLRQGLNLELKSAQQLEIEQVRAKYKKLIEEAKEHGLDLTELHNLQKAEEDRINKKYDEIEEADQAAKEEKDRQKRQQKIQDILRGAQQLTQALIDGISQIRAQNRQQELDAELATINQAAQASLSALDERHKAELSRTGLSERSKAQLERKYQAEKAAIEKKHRDEERRLKLKDWKANQQAAITQALINGALAITNILATRPKNDLGIGDAIMIAAAGVTTASQVALISGKKPPQFKYGGIPKGPSHSQGGIKLVSNGQAIAEMEGGEPIISRQTYANNKPVVDALLYSGLYRNGASINYPRFGIQPRLNFGRVQAANRPRYQQGGIAPTVTANNTTPADPANTELLTQLQSLMQQNQALLMQLNQRLAQPLTAVTIIGHKQADEIQELMEENQRISQSNGF